MKIFDVFGITDSMFLLSMAIFFSFSLRGIEPRYDLVMVGEMDYAEGLGKIPWSLHDALKGQFKIKMVDYKLNAKKYDCFSARVVMSTALRLEGCENQKKFFEQFPDSTLRVAYSVFESSEIPAHWVDFFNEFCDLVIVPDLFLVSVYKDCGVKVPIFVIPHGFYLERFMQEAKKTRFNDPFVFGMSAAFHQARKNQPLLIKAFARVFKNNPEVCLKIHSKGPAETLYKECEKLISDLGLSNVELMVKPLSDKKYIEFLRSLDCYVLVSSGEGYSITPREALALGIPCILSDTTAHKTICRTGHVRSIPCSLSQPAEYSQYPVPLGIQLSPTEEDVAQALLDVYTNRADYLVRARQSLPWLEQYLDKHVAQSFLSLFFPDKIFLGSMNFIEGNTVTMTSKRLYEKYGVA